MLAKKQKNSRFGLSIKDIIDNSKNKSYEILQENTNKIEAQIELLEKDVSEKIK